ncbi:hypothetical protein [Planctomycetes bacterium K23_9]|uniref:Uncharacterized protein n=1 Tax=Stieleria marina TaxID=1930275 RepID=A0A517NM39_9BACT|nr:hypothetical protein K239x_01210 [Planctomycetes bacterium K23_9]
MDNKGSTQPEITAEQYQERIKYENHLLYTRVQFLFVLNGFSTVALGLDQPTFAKFLLAIVMVLLNVFVTFALHQTDRVIAALTESSLKNHSADPLNSISQEVLGPYVWLRPNRIITRYVPVVICLAWTVGLVLGVASLK